MKKTLMFVILALNIGCVSAQLVETVHSPYKGGTVKYLNQGANAVIIARKKDADKKMKLACGGDAEILRSGTSSEYGGGLVTNSGFIIPISSEYVYISFKCVELTAKEKAEDDAYKAEFVAVQKRYPALDFMTKDASGKTLEYKILEYAQEKGIKTFTPAFEAYYKLNH